jgi:hypothetical protein
MEAAARSLLDRVYRGLQCKLDAFPRRGPAFDPRRESSIAGTVLHARANFKYLSVCAESVDQEQPNTLPWASVLTYETPLLSLPAVRALILRRHELVAWDYPPLADEQEQHAVLLKRVAHLA